MIEILIQKMQEFMKLFINSLICKSLCVHDVSNSENISYEVSNTYFLK